MTASRNVRWMMSAAAIATVASALAILVARPSPPPPDPIARAVAQLRSSE